MDRPVINSTSVEDLYPRLQVADWILDIVWVSPQTLAVGLSHNAVGLHEIRNGVWIVCTVVECEDRCLVYSMAIQPSLGVVASGTMFSDILVWNPIANTNSLIGNTKDFRADAKDLTVKAKDFKVEATDPRADDKDLKADDNKPRGEVESQSEGKTERQSEGKVDRQSEGEGEGKGKDKDPGPEAKGQRAEVKNPKSEGKDPKAEAKDQRSKSEEPIGEDKDTRGEYKGATGEGKDSKAEAKDPKSEGKDPKADAIDPRSKSKQPIGEGKDPRGEYKGATGEGKDPKAEAKGPSREGKDPKAEAKDQRSECITPRGDGKTGNPVQHRLQGHTGPVLRLLWDSQKPVLVSSGADKTIRVWELKHDTYGLMAVLTGHEERVWDIAWVLEDKELVSVGEDSNLMLWDMRTHTLIHKQQGAEKNIWRVVCYKGLIAAGANDGTVQLYHADRLRLQNSRTFTTPQSSSSLHYHWQLPTQTSTLTLSTIATAATEVGDKSGAKEQNRDYVKHVVLCSEKQTDGSLKHILLCSNLGRLYRLDLDNRTSELVFQDAQRISSLCPIPSALESELCILGFPRGRLAIVPRSRSLGPPRFANLFWIADNEHINTITVLQTATHVHFATCNVKGTIKEWLLTAADVSDTALHSLKVQCIREHQAECSAEFLAVCQVHVDSQSYIIAGDKQGRIHMFGQREEQSRELDSICMHKSQRVTSLQVCRQHVYSVGEDGRINKLTVTQGMYVPQAIAQKLTLLESFNVVAHPQISSMCVTLDGRIVIGGCTKTYGYVWNYTDDYMVFMSACEGKNRPLLFLHDPANPAALMCVFYSQTQVTIFNYLRDLPLNTIFIGPSFHSARALCLTVKRVHERLHLVVTGGEDSRARIYLFDCGESTATSRSHQSLTMHQSCVKVCKLLNTPSTGVFYLLTGGAQNELCLCEVNVTAGLTVRFLARTTLSAEDDVRVMDIDAWLCPENKMGLYVGTSAGCVHLLEYSFRDNTWTTKQQHGLSSAVLCCKLLRRLKHTRLKGLVGTTSGSLYIFDYSHVATGTVATLSDILPLHEFGLNSLHAKYIAEIQAYVLVTGGTDNKLSWTVIGDRVLQRSCIPTAHESSVRAVHLAKRNNELLVTSIGYDQRIHCWCVSPSSFKSSSWHAELLATTHTGVQDSNAICFVAQDVPGKYFLFVAGSCLEIFKLSL